MSSSRPKSISVLVSKRSIARLLSEVYTPTSLLASGDAVARRESELEAHHSSPSLASSSDCAAENPIRMGEPIRCRECGHRVMYKPRTKRSESGGSV
jgi:DNA-directed RNA polymerase subunit RPC12/RpoP